MEKRIIYLDNAKFHFSKLTKELFGLLPVWVIFGSPTNSDLPIIENVFGVLKARVRAQASASKYRFFFVL